MVNGLFEDEAFEEVGGAAVTGVIGAAGALTMGTVFLGAILEVED